MYFFGTLVFCLETEWRQHPAAPGRTAKPACPVLQDEPACAGGAPTQGVPLDMRGYLVAAYLGCAAVLLASGERLLVHYSSCISKTALRTYKTRAPRESSAPMLRISQRRSWNYWTYANLLPRELHSSLLLYATRTHAT